jgi:hypothetical protein
LSVRAAAEKFNVSRTTLQRHLENHIRCENKKFAYTNKCAVWTVFSGEEGRKFIDYITRASNMHYGLSRKDIMELAYEFTRKHKKIIPNHGT